jgi:polysaccharide biosynthesis/export protein
MLKLRTRYISTCLILAIASLSLAQTKPDVENEAAPAIAIQSGDLLEVSTFDVPELTRTVRVDTYGDIQLPLLDSVHAAGNTPTALAWNIDEKLKERKLLRNPQSSVFIKQYATQGVSLVGEVKKPGVYPVLGPRRLLDLLAEAGGLESTAACEARIQRRDSKETFVAYLSATNSQTSLENNPYLNPGDTVVISKAPVVYVIGDVVKPGGFLMQNDGHLSLLQALSLAGGPNRTASFRGAKLIRQTSNGRLQDTPVELDKLLAGKREDEQLQANDVLFVPNSFAKSTAKRTLESIFQVATGVAVYGAYHGY